MLWILLSLGVLMQPTDENAARVRKLIERLKDAKEPAAWSAAMELGEIGPAAKEALPALRDRLKAKSASDRGHAAAALLLIDQAEATRAFPVLLAVFKDDKEVLTQIGLLRPLGQRLKPTTTETVAGLLQLAAEGDATGWIIADQALDRVEARHKDAVAGLDAGLKQSQLKARILAARFLSKLDPKRSKDAIPILRDGISLEDVSLRLIAATHLLELDPKQLKAVVDALSPSLKDRKADTRIRIAVFLLERDAALADQSIPVLRETFKVADADDVFNAMNVVDAVGKMVRSKPDRFKVVYPLFEEALKSEMAQLRLTAIKRLGALGPQAQQAERHLRRAAKDENTEIAATAIETLMRLRPEDAGDRLQEFRKLVEKRDRTANGIAAFLKRFDMLRAQEEAKSKEPWVMGLVQVIDQSDRTGEDGWSRDELLRLHAIMELGNLKTRAEKGINVLARLVPDRDLKPILRAQAALALGRIGKQARAVIPVLNRTARDEAEAPDVRAAAREALRLIDRDKDS